MDLDLETERSNTHNLFFPCLLLYLYYVLILTMVTFAGNLGYHEPVTEIFKGSKKNILKQAQFEISDTSDKHREHLVVISSFLFALIWGLGAYLPSRYLQIWRMQGADMG